MARHVVFFVYPGFVLLDLSGPLEAFTLAAAMTPNAYRLSVVSLEGGDVKSSTCLTVKTLAGEPDTVDTFVVVGDFALAHRAATPEEIDFIRAISSRARRTASVCMGAFLLAAGGILDGRRATTHWRYAPKLQMLHPAIRVDGDRIFLADGNVWTSAGMTAGIDMALALIEEDLGREASKAVARNLVVYYRRPGGQHQHSSLLDIDPESDRIGHALAFAREHLSEQLPVERLADVAHLSVRQFSRAFLASTGMTPARAIERLRVEAARHRVEDGRETLDAIALSTGFDAPDRMRQSFVRLLGQPPLALRRTARRAATAELPSTASRKRSEDEGPGQMI